MKKKVESEESEEDLSEEEGYDAVVEGPDKENNEQSVNIKINNKQLFPSSNNHGKPPIPIKSTLKANILNDQRRSSTPDREKPLRERMNYQ